MLDDPTLAALGMVGLVGALMGLLGGLLARSNTLVATTLLGVIAAISAAAIARIAGADPIYGLGDSFSVVYGAAAGLLLGYVVGRNDRR